MRESAEQYWRRLFFEGQIDVTEFEQRIGPALEYDDKQSLNPRLDPQPKRPDPGEKVRL